MDNTTHESLMSGLCSIFYTPPAAWDTEELGVYEQISKWRNEVLDDLVGRRVEMPF